LEVGLARVLALQEGFIKSVMLDCTRQQQHSGTGIPSMAWTPGSESKSAFHNRVARRAASVLRIRAGTGSDRMREAHGSRDTTQLNQDTGMAGAAWAPPDGLPPWQRHDARLGIRDAGVSLQASELSRRDAFARSTWVECVAMKPRRRACQGWAAHGRGQPKSARHNLSTS
jgi:hypothetical protein